MKNRPLDVEVVSVSLGVISEINENAKFLNDIADLNKNATKRSKVMEYYDDTLILYELAGSYYTYFTNVRGEAPADGYILKSNDFEELVRAVLLSKNMFDRDDIEAILTIAFEDGFPNVWVDSVLPKN